MTLTATDAGGPRHEAAAAPATPKVTAVSERLGLSELITRLWADAPRRDTERVLFSDLRPQLRALRLGAVRLPREDGSRLPLSEFFELVLDLSAADSNFAHSLRNHYAAVEQHLLSPTASTPRILALARDGNLFGGAAQAETGSSAQAATSAFERQADGAFLLTDRRYYSTGSIYADYLVAGVTLDDGTQQSVLIETDRAGVELPDDWDGFGQRLTGSGSIAFDRVRVTVDDFVERPAPDPDYPRYTFTFNQVYLTTVVAGIANRAFADAVEIVRTRSRNYYHGTAERVQDEPVIQAAIGVASAKAFAATATIRAAAELLERAFAVPTDFAASLEATLAAIRAKITVEELALDVIDALTKVASGSTLSTTRALDRHWRNLKVLASHNPTIYKHRILGAYELDGTTPPLGVYF
ncbi:acyl-CoA dehydrogenase family protein [Dactylosporangium sp. NPDC051484]|uniref:acyl-CoA dehydrogenase family protein n=1 Tax=Dactylosporangium sp. NPDC051484 TaxID=3154942 RepID=UPI00344F1347